LRRKTLNIFLILLAFFVGVLSTALVFEYDPKANKVEQIVEINEQSISPAVDKIYNAVVTIESYKNGTLFGTGTGFIYKKDDKNGYILTNHHVIEGATSVKIVLANDEIVDGTLVSSDVYSDIAVIKIDAKNVLLVAGLGDNSKMRLGDTVFTVGSPKGTKYRGTVTKGVLSGKDRMVDVSINATSDWVMKVMQTDAAINPGNSGGPLLNINGEVIGINSLKLVQNEVEGMGFAIPIEDALYYAELLESGETVKRPLLGIEMYDVTDSYYMKQEKITIPDDITNGVYITSVLENTPASEGGMKKGDIVVAMGDIIIKNRAEFKYHLYKHKVGDKINVKVYRDSKYTTLTINLTKEAP